MNVTYLDTVTQERSIVSTVQLSDVLSNLGVIGVSVGSPPNNAWGSYTHGVHHREIMINFDRILNSYGDNPADYLPHVYDIFFHEALHAYQYANNNPHDWPTGEHENWGFGNMDKVHQLIAKAAADGENLLHNEVESQNICE